MLTLFQDQIEVMNDLRAAMKRSKAVLLQSPTGSGKTAMATHMVMSSAGRGNKMLFSVPRVDLLTQTSKTFLKYSVNHSFVAAGRDYNPFAQTYLGMVDTMANRIDHLPRVHTAVIDETSFGDDALGRVIARFKEPWMDTNTGKIVTPWVVGLDATPWKMNGQGLGIWYDVMVQGKSVRWLIENKRLSRYRYFYGRPRGDFAALRNKSDKEIAEYMENQRLIIGDCVHDYKLRGLGKIWLVRCTSIKHSELTAEAFRNEGIAAMHVDGKTPDDMKMKIFMAYARREIKVVTFANLLTFGFDLAQTTGLDVCVEGGSDQKPTQSLRDQMQWWGRLLRYKEEPAIINDHVNNYLVEGFGLPCSDRIWTLDSKKKRDGGEKVPPTRQCPTCMHVHPPAPKCPDCGLVYETEGREIKKIEGELEEADIEKLREIELKKKRIARGKEEFACKTLDDWMALAKKRGYKTGWATMRFQKMKPREKVQ